MTNKKISALTAATTPLAGTEVLPIVQSSATTKVSVANLTAGRAVAAQSVSTTSASNFSGGVNASAAVIIDKTGSTIGRMRLFVGDGTGSTVADDNYIGNLNTDLHIRAGTAGLVETFVFSSDGNLLPKVAAKGINFTANTGAAGMTSQLLNWYEEGTFTPAQGGGLTVVGAFSSTGKYTRNGRIVTVSGTVTGATSVAVTAAGIITTNLPFTVGTAGHGNATNAAVNAFAVVICTITNVTSAGAIAATATITFSATYFV
jgi:hypothetical protein